MSQKMANDDQAQAEVFKKELDEKWRKIDELKDKEQEHKEKIAQGKVELNQLAKQLEKGIDDIDEQNQLTLNDRKRIIEDLTKSNKFLICPPFRLARLLFQIVVPEDSKR